MPRAFIIIDTEDYEDGQLIISVHNIQSIRFNKRSLDELNLCPGDIADRYFYAEKTKQKIEDVTEWIESYDITFLNGDEVTAFLIDNRHFKSEKELIEYLNIKSKEN